MISNEAKTALKTALSVAYIISLDGNETFHTVVSFDSDVTDSDEVCLYVSSDDMGEKEYTMDDIIESAMDNKLSIKKLTDVEIPRF